MPKQRFDAEDAMPVALTLLERLEPFCSRIEIAGSLRRMKDEVGDIEILYVSRLDERQADMFSTEPVAVAEEEIGRMLVDGTLVKRPNVNGIFTWGPQNKLGVHVPSGIPVDLFSTTPENWWVSLVIRTGGKDTNLALTTGAQRLGKKLHAYGAGITEWDRTAPNMPREVLVPATSEKHVFELCGVPYAEPQNRK